MEIFNVFSYVLMVSLYAHCILRAIRLTPRYVAVDRQTSVRWHQRPTANLSTLTTR